MTEDVRLLEWLRRVALFSNDGWLAREARADHVALTGQEPPCGPYDGAAIRTEEAPTEPGWHCICGSGDGGEWHSLMCVASNTPDEEWHS